MAGNPPASGPQFHPALGPGAVAGTPFRPWAPERGSSAPVTAVFLGDSAALADSTSAVSVTAAPSDSEFAGISDGISVIKLPVPPPGFLLTPGDDTIPGPLAGNPPYPGTPEPLPRLALASPAFIRSQMPRMHVQNLVTGEWLHRDVQGVTSPSVTWQLSGADTFTCVLAPPRPDMLDSSGNPLLTEWQSACYLEESDEIKFGGILTSSAMQGPQLTATFTGFAGYPSGQPYEGNAYSQVRIDALDVVRFIWSWLQGQPGGDIGMLVDDTMSGVLLGAQTRAGTGASTLLGSPPVGSYLVAVRSSSSFQRGMNVLLGGGDPNVVFDIGGPGSFSGITSPEFMLLAYRIRDYHKDGTPIVQAPSPVPFTLDWWNSTDLGAELQSIQQEAVYDYRERHYWADPGKLAVRHRLHFGVPRIGSRRDDLRFCEGENIVQPAVVTRDGTAYANTVIGMGAGQGRTTVRAEVGNPGSRLRRAAVYQDQTVRRAGRMTVKARKVLQSMINPDAVTQVVVRNHPHAPFGSFAPGDDIPVRLCTGWRNALIWSRITSMTQDPTTDLMTLTLARSDSFDYLAQSGQAGTL